MLIRDEDVLLHLFNIAPTTSLRRAELQLGIPRSSLQRILKRDRQHPYRFHGVQGWEPNAM
jgi:hypothetical protein